MNKQTVTDTMKQFIRFGMVGGSGVLVNLVVTYLMTQLNGGVSNDNRVIFELPGPYAFRFTVLVWIVAFMVANVWNFQLNRRWTFRRETSQMRSWWREFWPFFAIGCLAAAFGVLIKVALTNPTSPVYLPGPLFNDHEGLRARGYWSQLFTIVLTMPINYLLNKVWTFRRVREADPLSAAEMASSRIREVERSEGS